MHIVLNGQPHEVEASLTVTELVDQLGLTGKAIAIAINRRVITSKKWGDTHFSENDQVEVVRAIGGG